jgi:hypothetical protein
MAFDPADFFDLHLGKLMACNADDGPAHGLSGSVVAKAAFGKASAEYLSLASARQTPQAFEKKAH